MNTNSFYDLFDTRSARIAFVGVLGILALFLLAETISVAQNFGRAGTPATDTITVNGDGQATLAPDVAHVSFTVQNTDTTVADAQAATTKQANAAIAYLQEQHIADKDVKTLSYNIYPQYSYPTPCPAGALCPTYSGNPKITGYQVSETIQVTIHDLTTVGTLLGGLGKLQVQNVNGPDFALDDPTAGYDAARADAIAKAKSQATKLAQELGVHLGKIVNFSESSGGGYYPMAYSKGMGVSTDAVGAPSPTVPVGQNTYNASVSVTYEIR
jgi:uncharacterized protein YggE